MMRRATGTFVALAFLLSGVGLADAAIIAEFAPASDFPAVDNGAGEVPGQEVLTGSGGPWNDITFSFLAEPPNVTAETPYASGTIFLLSQDYLGTPADLSSSTPGYVATGTANAAGTAWVFDPSVTLQPNTNYFFYDSTGAPTNAVSGSAPGYILGDPGFSANGFSFSVVGDNEAWNFRLSGDAAAPEPTSFILFGMAVTGLGVARWRKRKQTA